MRHFLQFLNHAKQPGRFIAIMLVALGMVLPTSSLQAQGTQLLAYLSSGGVSIYNVDTQSSAGFLSSNNALFMATTPDKAFLYVVANSRAEVHVFETATNTRVETIPIGTWPGTQLIDIAMTPDGAFAYVTDRNDGNVHVIRTSDNTLTTTIDVGGSAFGIEMTPDRQFAYVANENEGTVTVISTASNTVVETITVTSSTFNGLTQIAFTPDGAFAYVTNFAGNNVSVIQTSDNSVITTVTAGTRPYGIDITPDGAFAYVSNFGGNDATVIRTSDNTVVTTIPFTCTNDDGNGGTWSREVAVSPDGQFVYVAVQRCFNTEVISVATNTIVETISGGGIGIAFGELRPPCAITQLEAGDQGACNPGTNTYTQDVTVTYEGEPGSGDLVVNDQNFPITGSPQTVTLADLPADGLPVNVLASFSEESSCSLSASSLFTAPENCESDVPHEFTILANEQATLQKYAYVEGDIHSNEEAEYKRGTFHDGNVSAVSEIEVHKDAEITGMGTAPEFDYKGGASDANFGGGVTLSSVDSEDFPEVPPFTPGTEDIELEKGETRTLAPGSYGEIEVQDDATLNLSSGEYFIESIEVGKRAIVNLEATAGPVDLYIEDELSHKRDSEFNAIDGPVPTAQVNIWVASSRSIKIRKRTVFNGCNLVAPNAKVKVQKSAFFKGLICAREVDVQKRAVLVGHESTTTPKDMEVVLLNVGEELWMNTSAALPEGYALEQNYPNPFNPTTTIKFGLPEASQVTLKVFNPRGQLVRTLVSGNMSAGYHQIQWDATNESGVKVGSGMYFYQIQAKDFQEVKKMLLLK